MEPLTILNAPFGVRLELFYQGTQYLPYKMYHNEELLFSGSSFKCSPLLGIETMEAALDCLYFLCVRPGDTDAEYFADYTEGQLLWADSYDCEQLSGLVSDAGDKDSECHADAIGQFTLTDVQP